MNEKRESLVIMNSQNLLNNEYEFNVALLKGACKRATIYFDSTYPKGILSRNRNTEKIGVTAYFC